MKTTKGKKTLILQNPQMPLNVLKVFFYKYFFSYKFMINNNNNK